MREIISEHLQKKYIIMFLTSAIYILGLFAYFNNFGVFYAFLLMIFGLFAILKNYISPKLVIFWYFMFFFAFFNAQMRIKNTDALYQIAPKDATISGQVVSIPTSSKGDKSKFFFKVNKVDNQKFKGKTLVNLYSQNNDFSKISIGKTYTIKGKLRTPFEASNPSQFDYGKYLRNFNTYTIFYADANECISVEKELSPKWRFINTLDKIRTQIVEAHSKNLKSPNLEILGGIVFGDDAISPPDYIKKMFINSGLLHILAASGMNVAIIYGIWFFVMNKLKAPFKFCVLSGIGVVIFYSLMTGLGPSVVRAMFMLIFILLGKLLDRDAHSISLLAFVGLLMLIYNPAYINDVGFQLSFVVTFGLLAMSPIVFNKIKQIPNWLSGAIFIPIIAQIWVAPIQMFYFNSFSLYSVFANIAIVPFVSIISFGGFISSVLALIKPASGIICFLFDAVLNPFLNCLVWISQYFASLPHSLVTTIQPNIFQVILYYSLIMAITFLLKLGNHKKLITASCLIFTILCLSFINFGNNNLETICFDVQNADAFLIKTPQGKYFLIDSGKSGYRGSKSQAQAIILEYLKDKGIKNIEALILTHFDSDHAGGAYDILKNLKIKKVYINSHKDKTKTAERIYDYLNSHKNIQTITAQDNKIIYSEPNIKIKTFKANLNDDNENSIITIVSQNNFDELFMGDAGIEAYNKIKNNLPKNIEVLKVGHHGAKNTVNKQMLKYLNPQIAVVSTGKNVYGHPNSVTINLLESSGAKVFRTDRQNAIKIEANTSNYKVLTFDKNIKNYVLKTELNLN